MRKQNITGLIYVLTALILITIRIYSLHFEVSKVYQLESYFNMHYIMQLIPRALYSLILLCGILLLVNYLIANFYLAIFGHTTLEVILLLLPGLGHSDLLSFETIILFLFAVLSLVLAFTNYFKIKTLSVKEVLTSIGFGGLISVVPVVA